MNPQLLNEQIFYYTVAWMSYHKKIRCVQRQPDRCPAVENIC